MSCPKILKVVACFLLILCFFRAVNGAPFIGSSDVLSRLQEFEFDMTPIEELIDVWSDGNRYDYSGGSGAGTPGHIDPGRPPEDEMDWLDRIYYFLVDLYDAITDKLFAISRLLEYLWTDGISLFSLPIDLFVQLWDFTLWLLGFTV